MQPTAATKWQHLAWRPVGSKGSFNTRDPVVSADHTLRLKIQELRAAKLHAKGRPLAPGKVLICPSEERDVDAPAILILELP